MAERYRRRSALAHLGIEARAEIGDEPAGVTLGERAMRGMLNLRGDSTSEAFGDAVSGVLGIAPVVEPSRSARRRDVTMLWLGPDEWLVVVPDRRVERIERALRAALDPQHAALTDVSHSRAVLAVEGPDAVAVLAKGCPLDLHPGVFGPGQCAQSKLARCQVLIHRPGAAPAFELYVARSFADYAWSWLEDAGQEFGVRITAGEGRG